MGQHVRNLSTEQFFFGRAPKKKEENERESMSKNLTWLTGLCGFLYWHWLTPKRGFVVNEMLLHQKKSQPFPFIESL